MCSADCFTVLSRGSNGRLLVQSILKTNSPGGLLLHCMQFQDAIGLVQPVLVSVQGTWCEVSGKNGVFMKACES